MNLWTARFVAKLKELPELTSVATDQQDGGLAEKSGDRRVTASRLGISPATIDNTLYDAFGQRQVNTMYTQVNQYHVILESSPRFQLDPAALNRLYIQANASSGVAGSAAAASFASSGSASAGSNALTSTALYTPATTVLRAPGGALTASTATSSSSRGAGSAGTTSSTLASSVPLSSIAHFEKTTEPLTVSHQGQFPVITVSFDLAPHASLGAAIKAVNTVARQLHMPAGLAAGFQGTAASFTNSLSNEPLLVLAALVAVYIVLGVLYESFIHPVTILSTLPSAGVGALLALMLFGQDLDVVALIGIILLIGIVTKNGIMMVDFALDAERSQGKSPTEAIFEACQLRFSAHPDDHHGGTACRSATGDGLRFGFRTAPPARYCHGGRLAPQPDADAVHHTGDLYIFDSLSQRFARERRAQDATGEARPAGIA